MRRTTSSAIGSGAIAACCLAIGYLTAGLLGEIVGAIAGCCGAAAFGIWNGLRR